MKKELEFYGPLHFEQIEAPTGTIKDNYNKWPDPNKSGIYIWGFMYERHGDSLGNPVSFSIREIRYDSSSMQFIPYYVGIATGDSNVTINKRIKDHHNISHGNARKYTRLEWNYYPKFYKSFPISFKGKSNKEEFIRFVNDNPGKLIYFNNGEVLKEIFKKSSNFKPIGNGNHWPIDKQFTNSELEKKDTLRIIMNKEKYNNFWFCYAPVNNVLEKENFEKYGKKKYYEILEALTFWSLKGRTISRTGRPPKENTVEIVGLEDVNIFDRKNWPINEKDTFPGYL